MAASSPPWPQGRGTSHESRCRPVVTIVWQDSESEGSDSPKPRVCSLASPVAATFPQEDSLALHREFARTQAEAFRAQALARASTLLVTIEDETLLLPHPDGVDECCEAVSRCSLKEDKEAGNADSATHASTDARPAPSTTVVTERLARLTIAPPMPGPVTFACPKCGHIFGLRRTRDMHKARCKV
jgi:hypothetical protein